MEAESWSWWWDMKAKWKTQQSIPNSCSFSAAKRWRGPVRHPPKDPEEGGPYSGSRFFRLLSCSSLCLLTFWCCLNTCCLFVLPLSLLLPVLSFFLLLRLLVLNFSVAAPIHSSRNMPGAEIRTVVLSRLISVINSNPNFIVIQKLNGSRVMVLMMTHESKMEDTAIYSQ